MRLLTLTRLKFSDLKLVGIIVWMGYLSLAERLFPTRRELA